MSDYLYFWLAHAIVDLGMLLIISTIAGIAFYYWSNKK